MAKRSKGLKIWRPYPGITIRERVNTAGSISYRVDVGARVTGNHRLIRQFPTKGEAETYAFGVNTQRAEHGNIGFALSDMQRADAVRALEKLASLEITLTEAAEFYLRHARPAAGERRVSEVIQEMLDFKEIRQKARRRYILDLKSRLGRFAQTFGSRLIHEIRADEIESWLFEDDAISETTRDNYRRALSVLFGFAQGRRSGRRLSAPAYRADNPMLHVHRPVVEREPPVILTPDQAKSLLEIALEADSGLTKVVVEKALDGTPLKEAVASGMLAFIVLGLFCGVRTTELLQLRWENLSMHDADWFITIPPGVAKKRRIRNVPIPENARLWLSIAKRAPSGMIAAPNAVKKLPLLGKAANLSPWPNNCMRHSFGSYHFALHDNAAQTSSRLGHKEDDVLFAHYRALTSKADAGKFFAITPPNLGMTRSSDSSLIERETE